MTRWMTSWQVGLYRYEQVSKYDLLKASKSVPEFFAIAQLGTYFWTLDPCISLEVLVQSQKFSDGYRSS